MSGLIGLIWGFVTISIVVGYICWVNATLDKIWDDWSLSHEVKSKKVWEKQQEIANIGICMLVAPVAIVIGFFFALITSIIVR